MLLCTPPPRQSCSGCHHILPTKTPCTHPLPHFLPIEQSHRWKQEMSRIWGLHIKSWPAWASIQWKTTNIIFWFFHQLILSAAWQTLSLGHRCMHIFICFDISCWMTNYERLQKKTGLSGNFSHTRGVWPKPTCLCLFTKFFLHAKIILRC